MQDLRPQTLGLSRTIVVARQTAGNMPTPLDRALQSRNAVLGMLFMALNLQWLAELSQDLLV